MDVSGRPSTGKKWNPVYFDANANFWHDPQKATGVTPPQNKTPYKDLRIAGRVGEVLHWE